MKTWLCVICGLVYEEAKGWPDDGIAPGTRWEDVPETWTCPDCGVGKAEFEMLDITSDEPSPVAAATVNPVFTPAPAANAPGDPIVIIGSGHAGYRLAEALRERDYAGEIRVFTADDGAAYSKPALSNALLLGKNADDLIDETALDIERRLGVRVHAFCPVTAIDAPLKTLTTRLGQCAYGRLVLATGATPLRLDIDGDADRLHSINDRGDYDAFRRTLTGKKRIAVIGDGLIGCEFANDLAANGYAVDVVGIAGWPMERLLPEAAGRRVQRALASLGVRWHLESSLSKVQKTGNGFDLTLNDGRHLVADIALSAVGLSPNIDLARSAGVACGRGIRVDGHLQTSADNIYALGDCVEIGGRPLPYLAPINLAVRPLAMTLTGAPTSIEYPPMPVIVKTPAVPVTLVTPDEPGEWRIEEVGTGLRAIHEDAEGHVRGFALIGEALQNECSRWLQAMGQRKAA